MNTIAGMGTVARPSGSAKPQNLEQAAEAFEGLFLGNLLKAAREARDGATLGEGDQASGSMMDLAEEFLAQELAKGGGTGLARMVMEQLRQRGASAPVLDSSPAESSPAALTQSAAKD